MNEILTDFRDVLILTLGAMIGIVCSLIMWHKQVNEERRRKRSDILLKAIQLCLSTTTHTRCLLYSKTEGIKAVIELPENPVDEAMAIILLHFKSAWPLAQKLHLQQQDLFGHGTDAPNASSLMLELTQKIAETIQELVNHLRDIALKEKLGS